MNQPILLFQGGGGLKLLFFLSFLLVSYAGKIAAQTAFMTEYQPSQVSMTTLLTTRFNALKNDPRNQNAKIVATSDVRLTQANGKLSFLLPGLPDSLHAEATLISDDASGFTWSGKILNQPGYVSFLKLNGLTSGFIQVGTHFYEILPMTSNYQFLVERKSGSEKGCGSPGVTTTPPPGPGPNYCTYPTDENAYNTCPALIYVLLVITPAAKTYILNNYGSINDFVLQGQNQINLAFANSDIPNKEVAIKWIEKNLTQQNLSLSNPSDITLDRLALPGLLEPERTTYKADVAFLITDQAYGNAAGAVYDFGPSQSKAYGIVEAPYFISDYVVSHELGHLLGCHHNWPVTLGDDADGICAHAYRWIKDYGPTESGELYEVEESWMTLLGIPVFTSVDYLITPGDYYIRFPATANTRILHYSNPAVPYDGEATGVAAGYIANNARQIRNTACEVSTFFASQDLSIFIRTSNCSTVPFTFTADIVSPAPGLPGQGPYTVTWYWNTSGNFNPAFSGTETYLGTGQSWTVSPHPYCYKYWVKCKMVAADGTTVVRFKKIDLTPVYCFCQGSAPGDPPKERSAETSTAKNGDALVVYPNPVASGTITLEDRTLPYAEMQALVSDLSGRTVRKLPAVFDANGQAHLLLGALPDGLYTLWLHGTSTDVPRHLKFVISKN